MSFIDQGTVAAQANCCVAFTDTLSGSLCVSEVSDIFDAPPKTFLDPDTAAPLKYSAQLRFSHLRRTPLHKSHSKGNS
jgi:hypothetical protein